MNNINYDEISEETFICHCTQNQLGVIKNAIVNNNIQTLEEITEFTNAGKFCKCCVQPGGKKPKEYYLIDILEFMKNK